jgi:hypothetical protein
VTFDREWHSRMQNFLLLTALWVLSSVAAEPRAANWIFVHYHKTGHDLARKLADVFRHGTCTAAVRFQFDRRVSVLRHVNTLRETEIAVMAGPDMDGPWNATLLGKKDPTVRFVHFVRDPLDMVLSAYLYHAQEDSPVLEKWLHVKGFDPCGINARTLFDKFAKVIGTNYGDYMHVVDLIANTIQECHDLVPRNESFKTLTYYSMLRALSKEDGVVLEAARSILSATGGDILRMATNTIYETETNNGTSYRVFLAEFPIGDEAQFAESAQRLLRFLMRDTSDGQKHFWSCMSVRDAVRRSVELAFVPEKAAGAGGHVTQTMISTAERDRLKKHLMDNPSIGPLLAIVSEIINY